MISPKVNVLILNWNGQNVLNNCISSILKSDYKNYCITVIDNNSLDNSIANIIQDKKISIIQTGTNLGYAKGYNYCFKKISNLKDDYYLIINNDTMINNNTISGLVAASKMNGKFNIYGPKIINYNNEKNWFCGGKISLLTGHAYHLGINSKENDVMYKTTSVDFISGCCMFINKALISKVGGFNEKYHMYYEDVDFCLRAEKEKYKSIYVSNCFIYHLISYSIGGRYGFVKYIIKIKSFIKFLYYNNNIGLFIYYLLINLILSPLFLIYFLLKSK